MAKTKVSIGARACALGGLPVKARFFLNLYLFYQMSFLVCLLIRFLFARGFLLLLC
jgi:hypothetical protein